MGFEWLRHQPKRQQVSFKCKWCNTMRVMSEMRLWEVML